jgi:hypothetical protein
MGTVSKCCLVIVIGFSGTAACWADLFLVFNPATKTVEFSGTTSDTTSPKEYGTGSFVTWTTFATIPGALVSYFRTDGMATYDLPTPVTISNDSNTSTNDLGGYTYNYIHPGQDGEISFTFAILNDLSDSPPAPATITGNGKPVSYANYDAPTQSYFESLTAADPLVLGSFQTPGSLLTVYAVHAGDFNGDGHVDAADILLMEQALANPSSYEAAHNQLTHDELQTIGDINGDGVFNNADMQALLNKLKSGGGSNNPVPEPSTLVLAVLSFGLVRKSSSRIR